MNITKEDMDYYEAIQKGNEAGFKSVKEKIEEMILYSKDHNYPGKFTGSLDINEKGQTLKIEVFIPSGE